MTATPLVEVRDVRKAFGTFEALRGVDLDIARGEKVALVGASGSGKSTLCRCINRLETITSGTITFDGQPLPQEGKALAELRAQVGMVFQAFNLFPHFTALENVTLAPMRVRKVAKADADAEARELLAAWASRTRPTTTRPSCPVASSSGLRSPERSPCTRSSCSSTSRRRRSTRR